MNHWAFVIAAYAVTGIGTLALMLWAWRSMRSAEQQADSIKSRA
jgi:Heme exporter protein D (CcmD)